MLGSVGGGGRRYGGKARACTRCRTHPHSRRLRIQHATDPLLMLHLRAIPSGLIHRGSCRGNRELSAMHAVTHKILFSLTGA